MKFQRREEEPRDPGHASATEEKQAPNPAAAGAEFLAAADEAIARVMSGDAESFLKANRQQGGQ